MPYFIQGKNETLSFNTRSRASLEADYKKAELLSHMPLGWKRKDSKIIAKRTVS